MQTLELEKWNRLGHGHARGFHASSESKAEEAKCTKCMNQGQEAVTKFAVFPL
jgi:hypothetical protein